MVHLAFGTAFGFALSRSGATDYGFIQEMFLFESFQLYGIIGSAVAIAAPALFLLRRYGKTATGEPLEWKPKPFHRGTIAGGLLFGVGWSITGMCPGPILVNLGEGKLYAIAVLLGMLAGVSSFAALYDRIARLGLTQKY
jgi:hypothetical protein